MKSDSLIKLRTISNLKEKFKNKVTPAGIFFIFIFFITAAFGLNPEKSMLYQAGIFSISLLLVACLFTLKFTSNIKIERHFPKTCIVNKETRYMLTISNLNKNKISGFSFKDSVDSSQMISPIQNIPDIRAGDSVEIDAIFNSKTRGHTHIIGIYIFREDPLGLLRKSIFIRKPANILVLPKLYSIPIIKFTGNRKYHQGGVPYASKKGESEEFISLRNYNPGDPIKKINWKATAKTGETIVNEYQDEYFSRYGLVLDTFSTQKYSKTFEEAVSIAASILSSNDFGSSILDVMFLGIKPYTITVGNGINSQKHALEILSSIALCKNRQFSDLTSLIKKNIPLLNSLILLLIDIDENRAALIRFLEEQEIQLRIFVFSKKPAKCSQKIKELGIKTPIAILKVGDIETSLERIAR